MSTWVQTLSLRRDKTYNNILQAHIQEVYTILHVSTSLVHINIISFYSPFSFKCTRAVKLVILTHLSSFISSRAVSVQCAALLTTLRATNFLSLKKKREKDIFSMSLKKKRKKDTIFLVSNTAGQQRKGLATIFSMTKNCLIFRLDLLTKSDISIYRNSAINSRG